MRAQSPVIRRLKAQAGVQLVLVLGAAAVFLLCVAIIGAFKVSGDKTTVAAGPGKAASANAPTTTSTPNGVTGSTVPGGPAPGTPSAGGASANTGSGGG